MGAITLDGKKEIVYASDVDAVSHRGRGVEKWRESSHKLDLYNRQSSAVPALLVRTSSLIS